MTGNEKFDNDIGRVGAKLMEENRKILSFDKKKLEVDVWDFLGENVNSHKEVVISTRLNADSRATISNFHINTESEGFSCQICGDEGTDKKYVKILDKNRVFAGNLLHDNITIPLDDVKDYKYNELKNGDDILTKMFEIEFTNGTVVEIAFFKH